MLAAGVGAVPIVALTAFCSGLILAFQGGSELRKLGALELVIQLVAIGITREAGPLITAITVSGRSGSAFSAEIGAMVITDEISVLKTMALDPIQVLVSPKFLALLVVHAVPDRGSRLGRHTRRRMVCLQHGRDEPYGCIFVPRSIRFTFGILLAG